MKVTCQDCGTEYDDARRWTTCPHEPLMSDSELAQKDLACRLIGRDLHFNHDIGGAKHRIRSVGWNGMVTLDTLPGEFAPHLFTVADSHDTPAG